MSQNSRAKGPTQRQLRVGEMVRHVLSNILVRREIRDPDLTDALITVTEVRVSPDMRNATVFVLPLNDVASDTIVDALNRHTKFLRGELARSVDLKYTPALKFMHDTSFDKTSRIDELLNTPQVVRDLDTGSSSDS